MAELPDVGKQCELSTCNILDFTPFLCRLCSKHYCSNHRSLHGCDSSKIYDPSQASTSETPLKPYLCTLEGCSQAESIKIVCPFCSHNFCLKHRNAEDHTCAHIPNNDQKKQEVKEKMNQIREALGVTTEPQVPKEKVEKSAKPISEAQQKTMDRIAVMKLKMQNRPDLGPNEKMVIFVETDEQRLPVMISKNWSIGKAMDFVAKSRSDVTMPLIVVHKTTDKTLEFSDITSKVLTELDTLIVKKA